MSRIPITLRNRFCQLFVFSRNNEMFLEGLFTLKMNVFYKECHHPSSLENFVLYFLYNNANL